MTATKGGLSFIVRNVIPFDSAISSNLLLFVWTTERGKYPDPMSSALRYLPTGTRVGLPPLEAGGPEFYPGSPVRERSHRPLRLHNLCPSDRNDLHA